MEDKHKKKSVESWGALFHAYRVLRNKAEEELKQAELPPLLWYDVLWETYKSPEGRIRQFELGTRMLLNKHNLSRLLDRLSKQKLITRIPCTGDKRGFYIEITPSGRSMLSDMWKVYGKTIENHFSKHYTEAEMARLHELISRLY